MCQDQIWRKVRPEGENVRRALIGVLRELQVIEAAMDRKLSTGEGRSRKR